MVGMKQNLRRTKQSSDCAGMIKWDYLLKQYHVEVVVH